jgi:V8-like Glu-specific endopeptidase
MRYTVGDLAQARNRILANDPELAAHIHKLAGARRKPSWLSHAVDGLRDLSQLPIAEAIAPDFELESIVQRVGRPVLGVIDGKIDLDTTSAEDQVWNARLQAAAAVLGPSIPAVGRVEATNWPTGLPYVGTGWLIEQNLIVTNRHVALEFAERGQTGFKFQLGFDRRNPVAVDIDFLEEVDNTATDRYDIGDILYIARDTEPDVAFLRLGPGKGPLARPIKLASQLLPSKTMVGVVGYPGRDPRIPDQDLMAKIFGNVFDKKRFAPGFVTGFQTDALTHDCTTLGGNSGSAVLDLLTGEAAALHFSGVFLKSNYAVPAPVISGLLARVKQAASITVSSSAQKPAQHAMSSTSSANFNQTGDAVTNTTIVVPLQITISLGNPTGTVADLNLSTVPGGTAKGPAPGAAKAPSPDALTSAVVEARRTLLNRADVISIQPGYRVADGWITDERCLVVSVKKKLEPAELAAAGLTPLTESINGIPVDVSVGIVADRESYLMLEAMQKARRELIGNYQKPDDMPLVELNEPMQVVAHAGPDAGWPLLEPFFGRVKKQLTIGMYEFTAPHVVKSCVAAIKPAGRKTSLVLQNRDEKKEATTVNDLTEQATVDTLTKAAGKRLSFSWASVSGPDRLFATSYHIKVAVRDQQEMWLSSGSWRSSNQAPFDPIKNGDQSPPLLQRYDRDWHILLTNKPLATLMEKYLLRDEKQAAALEEALALAALEPEFWVSEAYFRATDDEAKVVAKYRSPLNINRKVRVQPLLTPDNYAEHVVPLIQNATKSVYFQNQSLDARASGENGDVFESLLQALLDKQKNAEIDVRIIFRRFPSMRQTLTGMKDFGFNTSKTKVRVQTNCHTKGIIIDGETVVVGSHNWTRAGTTLNRDASLIFFDQDIARYYQDLFLFDWSRIANVGIDESLPAPEAVRPEEGLEPGRLKLRASELLGD